jgi:hypothetical protein
LDCDAKAVLPYQWLQDSLEAYFSKQRSCGGSSDNPDMYKFV